MEVHPNRRPTKPIFSLASQEDYMDESEGYEDASTPTYTHESPLYCTPSTPNGSNTPILNRTGSFNGRTPPMTPPLNQGTIPTATPKKAAGRTAEKRAEMSQARKDSFSGLLTRDFRGSFAPSSESGSMEIQVHLSASSENLTRPASGIFKRRDSGFLNRLPAPRPDLPLHRQNSERTLPAPVPSSSMNTTATYQPSFGEHMPPAHPATPAVDMRELSTNHNPFTPETNGASSRHANLKVPANASRFIVDFAPEKRLGKGSYGEVELAIHRFDGWSYAVKRQSYVQPLNVLDKVQNEVFMLASLNHPHIVRYHGAWVETDPSNSRSREVYIQTEFCQGESLTKWWKAWLKEIGMDRILEALNIRPDRIANSMQNAEGRFGAALQPQPSPLATPSGHRRPTPHPQLNFSSMPPQRVMGFGAAKPDQETVNRTFQRIEAKLCEIMRQMCLALQYLHEEKRVVHLDFKPDNIFVQQEKMDKESAVFKIGDCGSMRKLFEPAQSPRGTLQNLFPQNGATVPPQTGLRSSNGFETPRTSFDGSSPSQQQVTPTFKGRSSSSLSQTGYISPTQQMLPSTQQGNRTQSSPVHQLTFASHEVPPMTPLRSNGAVVPEVFENEDLEEGDGRYLAPEILDSATLLRSEDLPKADIYALGCSIVELAVIAVSGKMPDDGSEATLPAQFSQDFKFIVECMLWPNPRDRPSASELLKQSLLWSPEVKNVTHTLTSRIEQLEAELEQYRRLAQQGGFVRCDPLEYAEIENYQNMRG